MDARAAAPAQDESAAMAAEVRAGLTRALQKTLPAKFFYDEIGSALFELITLLPEYGLTRAEERLLQAHAGGMLARLPPLGCVAELGAGSGRKTRHLLEAATRRGPVTYCPIEISAAALAACRRTLDGMADLRIAGIEQDYLAGLAEAAAMRRGDAAMLVLFLGSTIGNFEPVEAQRFVAALRSRLRRGDALLLGTDLDKPLARVLPAYDDALGITAAFNLNQLARLNRELGADFALRRFRHEVRFDAATRAVQMHLRSLATQTVRIPGAGLTIVLREGETIFTETSRKFLAAEAVELGRAAGFECIGQWCDDEWPFADSLLVAV